MGINSWGLRTLDALIPRTGRFIREDGEVVNVVNGLGFNVNPLAAGNIRLVADAHTRIHRGPPDHAPGARWVRGSAVIYEPHPVSAQRKAELREQGFQIVDAIYAPQSELPAEPTKAEDKPRRGRKPAQSQE